MKKKFASFLMTGKAATLPFFAGNSLADMPMEQLVSSDEIHVVETPTNCINLLNRADEVEVAAQIMTEGQCSPPPSVMNVVITGLKNGDQVYLGSADDLGGFTDAEELPKDDIFVGETDFRFLTHFVLESADLGQMWDSYNYGETDFENALHTVSIPVPLEQQTLSTSGNPTGFYLQVMVVRDDLLLFSEIDKVERVGSSTPYDGGDGGDGGVYGGDGTGGDGGTSGSPDNGGDPYGGTGGDGGTSGGTGGDGGDSYGGTGGDGGTSGGTGGDGGDSYGGTGGDGGSGSSY